MMMVMNHVSVRIQPSHKGRRSERKSQHFWIQSLNFWTFEKTKRVAIFRSSHAHSNENNARNPPRKRYSRPSRVEENEKISLVDCLSNQSTSSFATMCVPLTALRTKANKKHKLFSSASDSRQTNTLWCRCSFCLRAWLDRHLKMDVDSQTGK